MVQVCILPDTPALKKKKCHHVFSGTPPFPSSAKDDRGKPETLIMAEEDLGLGDWFEIESHFICEAVSMAATFWAVVAFRIFLLLGQAKVPLGH